MSFSLNSLSNIKYNFLIKHFYNFWRKKNKPIDKNNKKAPKSLLIPKNLFFLSFGKANSKQWKLKINCLENEYFRLSQ